MLKFISALFLIIPFVICFKEPPTQLAVFQRILASFNLPAVQITTLHTDFDKVDTDQSRWNAVKLFLTKVPAAKQPAVKAILLELMDNVYMKFTGMSQGEAVFAMNAAQKTKFSAAYAELDAKYKGDDSQYLPLLLKTLNTMFPPAKNAAVWKKFGAWAATPLIKSFIAKNQQFFHWDGKNKTAAYYFNAKGYKRSKAPWEANVKM